MLLRGTLTSWMLTISSLESASLLVLTSTSAADCRDPSAAPPWPLQVLHWLVSYTYKTMSLLRLRILSDAQSQTCLAQLLQAFVGVWPPCLNCITCCISIGPGSNDSEGTQQLVLLVSSRSDEVTKDLQLPCWPSTVRQVCQLPS